MELLLIWFLFGIISAVVASNKGRSGFAWFLIGVLLGPFGLLFALVVSKDTEALDRASLSSGELKRCYHCAELIKREAIKCRHCGEAIDNDIAPDPPRDSTILKTASEKFGEDKRPPERTKGMFIVLNLALISIVASMVIFGDKQLQQYTENKSAKPINVVSDRAETLDSLCQDMVYQKAKMYKYTREGDHKAAYAAEKLFMAFSEDLAQYTDNEVKMACNKYDNYEYMKRYL